VHYCILFKLVLLKIKIIVFVRIICRHEVISRTRRMHDASVKNASIRCSATSFIRSSMFILIKVLLTELQHVIFITSKV
jgi:hypothetical protein